MQTMDRINMGIHISFPVGSIGCSIAKLKIKLNTPTVPICTMAIVMELDWSSIFNKEKSEKIEEAVE